MKYGTLAALFGLILFTGCGIAKKIDNATNKCESIVSEALEGLEDSCLTRDEILWLVREFQGEEPDTRYPECRQDTLP